MHRSGDVLLAEFLLIFSGGGVGREFGATELGKSVGTTPVPTADHCLR